MELVLLLLALPLTPDEERVAAPATTEATVGPFVSAILLLV